LSNSIVRSSLNKKLESIAKQLDISEALFEKAKARYEAIGQWLGRENSNLEHLEIKIYPQGSIGLGTANKPINNNEEYDIDLVCELSIAKINTTQQRLKNAIGEEIKAYARANNMLEEPVEGKRCWTLNYSDQAKFHMDILPAVPDGDEFRRLLETKGMISNHAGDAICITDNTLPPEQYQVINRNWPVSNPKGYLKWFKDRMTTRFSINKRLLADSLKLADIANIPDYKVKTPLQQAIQLLKRHRDLMFQDDPDNKPISIIITTLAAHAYQNQEGLVETLDAIATNMSRYLEDRNGTPWVQNPSNPLENFADKWVKNTKLKENFDRWVKQVRVDLVCLFLALDDSKLDDKLEHMFGSKNMAPKKSTLAVTTSKSILPSKFDVPHRKKPQWPISIQHPLIVTGKIKIRDEWHSFNSDCDPLPKGCELLFQARTNIDPNFEVFWQIVNTGNEAARNTKLRGDILQSKTAGMGGLTQKEATAYTGMHWVQCFIVKNNVLVAKSDEFVVNIA
jgi:hypothetical protein